MTALDTAGALGPARQPAAGLLDLARAELGRPDEAFRAAQTAAVLRHAPLLAIGNLATGVAFVWLGHDLYPATLLWLWAGALTLASAFGLMAKSPAWIEVQAIALGLVWAAFPALFSAQAPADLKPFIVAAPLIAAGIGAFALARLPAAAVVFSLIVAGALAMSAARFGGAFGSILGGLALAYGLILTGMILGLHRDALARAADAAALARQGEIIGFLLKDFEHGSSDWLWETDQAGQLIYFSERLTDLLGRGPKRLHGATLQQAAGATVAHEGWTALAAAMAEGRPVAELVLERPFGQVSAWWQVNAQPRRDAAGALIGYRGVGRDITERQRAQAELLKAKADAEQSSAAKSQFLAVMSHELKTPLNAITGFAELLVEPGPMPLPDATQLEYSRTILDSGLHLRALIDNILDVTRLDHGKLALNEQECDAGEIAEVAVKMCAESAARHRVSVIADLPPGIEIVCDITRIRQVLINLVTNAIKFSPAETDVLVALERTPGGGLAVAVMDSGVGIPQADLARVFEPFVQVESGAARRYGGIGLGLPIARKIARLHGGDVTLESRLGRGTTARLELPAARVRWPLTRSGVAARTAA